MITKLQLSRALAAATFALVCAIFPARAAQALYLSDNVVNVAPANISNNGSGWQFEFDEDRHLYHITVPAGTATSYPNSGDFQISTVPGSYADWKTGLVYYAPESTSPDYVNATNSKVAPGQVYTVTHGSNSAGHWMTITPYNYLTSYTIYVSETLDRMWVVPSMYISDYAAGSGGWSSPDLRVKQMDYDPVAEQYTVYIPGGEGYSSTKGEFQFSSNVVNTSSATSQLTTWQSSLYYVAGDSNPKMTNADTWYDLSHSTSGSHWMSITDYDYTKGYRFTIKGDLSQMSYTEVDDPSLWIGGETANSAVNNTNFDGLGYTAGTATRMDYDPVTGIFSYAGTTKLKGRFSLFDSRQWHKRYTCINMASSDDLLFNTPYSLEEAAGNSGRDQQFLQTNTASKITVYVDMANKKVWGVADDKEPYFLSDGDGLTHYQPGEFVSNPDGSWTYKFGILDHRAKTIELSRLRSASQDGVDYGFPLAQVTASGTLDLNGAPVSLTSGSGAIVIPEGFNRELTISADGTTIVLTGTTGAPDFYLSDYVVGVAPEGYLTNGKGWQFSYDETLDAYKLYVPSGTSTYGTGDFQISTRTGDYTRWKAGLVYYSGYDYTYTGDPGGSTITPDGTRYTLVSVDPDNTGGHWMSIKNYSNKRGYTFYISGDMTRSWVVADGDPLYIIGHLTNQLSGAYDYAGGTSIRRMEFNPDTQDYSFAMAGARWSVFEISTAGPTASYHGEDGWVNNMVIYPAVDGSNNPVVQPVLLANPFNATGELVKYTTVRGHDNQTLGPDYSTTEINRNKRDFSINGYNPDWLYTVHVNKDLTEMWIMEQPINMPLKALDFIDQSTVTAVPHYFVVGSRTADWRLLPEWELTPDDSGQSVSLEGRFMYDGYFGIAKVDNYLDYIHHRYTIFANSLATDQDYTITAANKALIENDGDHNYPLRTIQLKNCGTSGALRYNADDPVHDTSNSITWDIGVAKLAASGGVSTAEMMRYALPFRFSSLTVALDGNGDPASLTPVGSYHRKIINEYRTFSLVGTDINYETPYDFGNALGVRDLRTMTSTYANGGASEKNWSNAWIAYDNDVPYYDAYQNTLFVTAYDKNWQSNHRSIFDIDLGDTVAVAHGEGEDPESETPVKQMLVYSSDRLTFTKANPNDPDDEYAWVYGMHPRGIVGDTEVGSDVIGFDDNKGAYNVVEDEAHSDTDYRYQERLADYTIKDNLSEPTLHDSRVGYTAAPTESTDGWVCYVLKDVYLKGDFIVGSGWGGGVASAEGYSIDPEQENVDVPRNNLRMFFGNFSPRREYDSNDETGGTFAYDDKSWGYTVHGYDLKTTFDPEAPGGANNNAKLLYPTFRDIDDTNFRTEGTVYEDVAAGGEPDYENVGKPQYYNRIILWYNTNVDRLNQGVANGVIQFIQETIAPNAKLYRNSKEPNRFYVNWDIVDRTGGESDYDNWKVLSYTVTRYRYGTTTDEDGEDVQTPQVYRVFDPVDLDGVLVQDVKSGSPITFDDPYALPPDEYFYTVKVTIQNPDDPTDVRYKTATTNTLAVASLFKTANIEVKQQMETDANDLKRYSFNVEAKTSLANDNTTLNSESSHETAVWKDAGYISIKVDDYTRAALEKATSVEISNAKYLELWNAEGTGWWTSDHPGEDVPVANANLPFSQTYTYNHRSDNDDISRNHVPTPYIGWRLVDECVDDDGNPKFNAQNEIRFKLQRWYWSNRTRNSQTGEYSDGEDYWLFFSTLDRLRTLVQFPTIVWHNVEPTENLTGTDKKQYTLSAYMGPIDATTNVFVKDEDGNDVYQEMSLDTYWTENLELKPDKASTGVYAPSMTLALTKIGMTASEQTVDTGEADYSGKSPTEGSNMPVGAMSDATTTNDPVIYDRANEVSATVNATIPVTDEVLDNHVITGTMRVDNAWCDFAVGAVGQVTTKAHNLPYFSEAKDEREWGPNNYSRFMRQPAARVSHGYQPVSFARYERYPGGDPNAEAVYDVTSAPRRGTASSFGCEMATPTVDRTAQMLHTYWLPPEGAQNTTDLTKGVWWTSLLIQLGVTGHDTTLNGYFGFHAAPHNGYEAGAMGARANQGGHPMHAAAYSSYSDRVPVINGYVDWDGESDYKAANNWSWLAAKEGKLSLNAGVVGMKTNSATSPKAADFSAYTYPEIEVYVVYPVIPSSYLSVEDIVPDIQSSVRRRTKAAGGVEHDELVPVTVSGSYQSAYNPEDYVMTGVEDVVGDQGPTGIYNMQGIKVDGTSLPTGVYIMRRGDSATKVLVR